jgi:hypothetical protein
MCERLTSISDHVIESIRQPSNLVSQARILAFVFDVESEDTECRWKRSVQLVQVDAVDPGGGEDKGVGSGLEKLGDQS